MPDRVPSLNPSPTSVWIQWNGIGGIVELWNGFFFSSILFAGLSIKYVLVMATLKS